MQVSLFTLESLSKKELQDRLLFNNNYIQENKSSKDHNILDLIRDCINENREIEKLIANFKCNKSCVNCKKSEGKVFNGVGKEYSLEYLKGLRGRVYQVESKNFITNLIDKANSNGKVPTTPRESTLLQQIIRDGSIMSKQFSNIN
jgi:hypothetical protein